MTTFTRSIGFVLGLPWLLAVLPTQAALDDETRARLEAWHHHPERLGERVYAGQVFARQQGAGPRLFSYERRITRTPEGLTATHLTRDESGTVAVVEAAQLTPRYELRRFEAVHAQLGYSGTVQASPDGRSLSFRLVQGGQVSTATETLNAPAVSGPSLHGFIQQQWAALEGGATLPVRMVVLAEKQTYGFDITLASRGEGHTTFAITPSRWWVRLAVAPLAVTFDNRTHQPLRYEGRVPPALWRDGRHVALDARVEYEAEPAEYR